MKRILLVVVLFLMGCLWVGCPTSPTIIITTTSPVPDAVRGQVYKLQLAASGGTTPYKWTSISGLPPGLQLSQDGILSGIPTKQGVYHMTVSVQ